MDNKFPKDFLWGASTSAYQVEGAATTHGKKLSQQDVIKESDVNNREVFKIHKDPKIEDLDQIVGNLYLNGTILLIPILKHYKHIDALTTIFKSNDFIEAMEDETVLIIDDEADQASLNSYGRKNSKKADDEEEEKSRTYDSILKMRNALPGNTYIQYTATPQANILISMKDMLSPKSHTLLTPGEGYIGGKLYFGRGKNHDLYRGRLVREIPSDEVFHKTKNPLNRMPKSLKDALLMHILAVAIVVKFLHRDGVKYLSMMVHPATEKKYNSKFKKWIEAQLKSWRKSIRKDDGNDDKRSLLQRLRELFPSAVQFYNDDERPEFEELKPYIEEVLCTWKVYLVNTDKDAQKEIEWDEYTMHVLVGAEMLNRGFTVENLATTYMPRYSTGPANADTIQQRCRFFGYKRDYIESCRVFLPGWTMADYKAYVDHEEELRSVLASCDTLAAAERKILLSPKMKATRANVLPISIVNSQLIGVKEMQAYESKERIEQNKRVAVAFVEKHIDDFDIEQDFGTDDRCHRGFRMTIEEAIEFLDDFQFGNYKDATRKAATIRYLRYLSEKEDEPLKFVYFYQMAYKRVGENIRPRRFKAPNFRAVFRHDRHQRIFADGLMHRMRSRSVAVRHMQGAVIRHKDAGQLHGTFIHPPGPIKSSYRIIRHTGKLIFPIETLIEVFHLTVFRNHFQVNRDRAGSNSDAHKGTRMRNRGIKRRNEIPVASYDQRREGRTFL